MSASYDDLMASLGLEPSAPKRPPAAHGDRRRYQRGCRCDECREANRLYKASWRAKRRSDPSLLGRATHGKASTYRQYGCRCDECRTANSADVAAWRARRRERAGGGS
ncbi:hypothetical protein ABZ235_30580 [Streptomyces canus]|uniref:hypothetical protein n=1 Tax=Streptomyces canus TaxID=58343 RepID=UPI0033AFC10E